MRRNWILIACLLLILPGIEAAAQTGTAASFESDQTTGPVVSSQVTHAIALDTVAVEGVSVPTANFGAGGAFSGGWTGVVGAALAPGVGERTGSFGWGEGGADVNYGVQGWAGGPDASVNLGVYGWAYCTAGPCSGAAIYADGDVAYTGALVNLSDLKFKENIEGLQSGLSDLLKLEVVTYQHKTGPEFEHINLSDGQQVGFIAQQVAEVLPDLVVEAAHPTNTRRERTKDVGDVTRYQALKTVQMIPYLVKAIQEQQAQIEELKTQIAPLKNRLAELEGSQGTATLAAISP